MVKIERAPTPPKSLAVESKKVNGSYREADVIAQLNQDFYGKCYLCEIDQLQSVEVEHLHPHNGDRGLMFDWNNLFFSCAHCNSVKNQKKYHNMILDCCTTDPETVLEQRLLGGHVSVKPLDTASTTLMTAELLTECFEKDNTGIRVIECQTRINGLYAVMDTLYQALERYREEPSEHDLRILQGMLSRTYPFSGFTSTYVRLHLEDYPALAEYVAL